MDAMDTPTFSHGDPGAGAAMLLDKLERIRKNITGGTEMLRTIAMPVVPGPTASTKQLVAIGASAGGPAALARLLSALPQPFPAATIIVQHVDGRFSSGLADWLSQQSSHTVSLADAGDRPIAGTVLLARGDDHLRLGRTGLLEYTSEPREYAYRPSVDVFFQSICDFWPHDAVGVLLTGMGRDGAVGLKSLRDKGWPTIAQDEATSIVYGMPKAAARLNAADEILPLDQIAPRLAAIAARSGRLQAMRQ
jgi:chemotaxis response regulator CheB